MAINSKTAFSKRIRDQFSIQENSLFKKDYQLHPKKPTGNPQIQIQPSRRNNTLNDKHTQLSKRNSEKSFLIAI